MKFPTSSRPCWSRKGFPGTLIICVPARRTGPIDSIVYKVEDVLIHVRNIEFTGIGAAELPALESAAEKLANREYSRSRLDLLVQRQFLPVLYARGFLKAAFGEPQPKVVKLPSAETPGAETEDGPRNQTVVDVSFAVTPGLQFKLKAIAWSGNHEFPDEVLQKMVRAQPGEPANTMRLADNLKDIQKLYGSRGYVTAALKAEAEFDDAAGTVVIHLKVKEGFELPHGRTGISRTGQQPDSKTPDAWKIRFGDVYDATYLSEYLPAAHKLLPAALDWEVSPHVTANVRDKTVDVDLIYSVKAPK